MSKVGYIKEELSKLHTGYGLMSLTWKPVPVSKEISFESMRQVIALAESNKTKAFFNVGEFYGPDFINLNYVRDFFAKYPDLRKEVIISCKGGINNQTFMSEGKYDDVITSVENCIREIGGYIDLFEVARLDESLIKAGEEYPRESFEALAKLVDGGLIGGISLSEVTSPQIRAIAKDFGKYLTCVEVELSLFSLNIFENDVAKACSDLNLIIICYSPLGRGLLTGQVTSNADIPEGDIRKKMKRFHGDSLQQNLLLVKFLRTEIVDKRDAAHQVTLPQVALGWIKHWNGQKKYAGAKFIPIPSGSTIDRVNENFDEQKCTITDEEFQKINKFLEQFETQGDRYEHA
ncbi:hypothetical protein KAFR_0A05360 [Kazachstania africana CBS 2517]|uniref:NADP-dependent oxidoreductase domain-containing protein n=1 Tax=Kazachstania africana (strain ATCC 22294 / BCRC 22015 / CBS 2517 / CECT 1963 / NBRC 1671 / NRRL Y-8276) TaxID=1071382 RepID=H2ANM1_KAZAF|nr:hypothetical protein KAFR_0A05360 [Kazachstania africana CBS 2517]CCF55971.1 hypothetical protein KAFR_0A05360 [Kazachstania africana CBS 2517]